MSRLTALGFVVGGMALWLATISRTAARGRGFAAADRHRPVVVVPVRAFLGRVHRPVFARAHARFAAARRVAAAHGAFDGGRVLLLRIFHPLRVGQANGRGAPDARDPRDLFRVDGPVAIHLRRRGAGAVRQRRGTRIDLVPGARRRRAHAAHRRGRRKAAGERRRRRQHGAPPAAGSDPGAAARRRADAAFRTHGHARARSGRFGVRAARGDRVHHLRARSTPRAANAPTRCGATPNARCALSEERNQLIVETALDGVITINGQRHWSPAGTRRPKRCSAGLAPRCMGRELAELIIPERLREDHRSGMRRYIESGVARVLNKRIEMSALHRDGREFPVELAITPIGFGDDLVFSAIHPRHHRPHPRRSRAARERAAFPHHRECGAGAHLDERPGQALHVVQPALARFRRPRHRTGTRRRLVRQPASGRFRPHARHLSRRVRRAPFVRDGIPPAAR